MSESAAGYLHNPALLRRTGPERGTSIALVPARNLPSPKFRVKDKRMRLLLKNRPG